MIIYVGEEGITAENVIREDHLFDAVEPQSRVLVVLRLRGYAGTWRAT
jgi:hypothetical protein